MTMPDRLSAEQRSENMRRIVSEAHHVRDEASRLLREAQQLRQRTEVEWRRTKALAKTIAEGVSQ